MVTVVQLQFEHLQVVNLESWQRKQNLKHKTLFNLQKEKKIPFTSFVIQCWKNGAIGINMNYL